jgi:hypothetical protein
MLCYFGRRFFFVTFILLVVDYLHIIRLSINLYLDQWVLLVWLFFIWLFIYIHFQNIAIFVRLQLLIYLNLSKNFSSFEFMDLQEIFIMIQLLWFLCYLIFILSTFEYLYSIIISHLSHHLLISIELIELPSHISLLNFEFYNYSYSMLKCIPWRFWCLKRITNQLLIVWLNVHMHHIQSSRYLSLLPFLFDPLT